MTAADKTDHFENISIVMIVGGFVLYFLKSDSSFWWIMFGFLSVGIISLIKEIKTKSTKGMTRMVRIIFPLLIIALVIRGLLYGGAGLLLILIVLIMYTFIKQKAIN